MVFGRIWSFVKRHRRKFVFAGVVVAGAVWLSRYARRRLREFQEKEATECLAHIRRQHHFDSNQRTCNSTVLSVLPCLREALCQKLNTERLTDQLRSRPSNKVEIWEELKMMSFTRTAVAVYGCCFLVIYLRVQLNILGGYMYVDSQQSTSNGKSANEVIITSDIQKHYLAGVQYIFGQGLDNLISDVQRAVRNVVSSYSLKDQVSSVTIQDIVSDVRRQVEYRRENGYHDVTSSSLCRYMMPTSEGESQACGLTKEEIALCKLKNETKDMIESSDFHTVMTICLDSGFSRLVDKIAEYFLPAAQPEQATPMQTLPLAKVIPIVNGLVHNVLADAPNPFLQDLLLKDQVKDFAANVYEAFCQSHDNKCSIN